MESIAKVFKTVDLKRLGCQKRFVLKGNEVKISKEGDKVILEPLERSKWPEGFWDVFLVDKEFRTPEPLPPKNFNFD